MQVALDEFLSVAQKIEVGEVAPHGHAEVIQLHTHCRTVAASGHDLDFANRHVQPLIESTHMVVRAQHQVGPFICSHRCNAFLYHVARCRRRQVRQRHVDRHILQDIRRAEAIDIIPARRQRDANRQCGMIRIDGIG